MDGRCKALDSSADGYVRAEAVGSLVMRPRDSLEASLKATVGALANNVALLLGTAINQDGRSSSLTAPNGPAQSSLINTALHTAHLHASKASCLLRVVHGCLLMLTCSCSRLLTAIECYSLAADIVT